MKQRIITGVLLAILLIPVLFLPSLLFFIVVGLASVLASFEMSRMFKRKDIFSPYMHVIHSLFTLSLYSLLVVAFTHGIGFEGLLTYLVIMLTVNFGIMVFDDKMRFALMGKFMSSNLYLGISFAALAFLWTEGLQVIFYVLIVAMLTDIFAYFTGVKFGKHKLAPKISPKKTIEGAVGGTFFGVLLGTLFGLMFNLFEFEGLTVYVLWLILIGLTVSISAQLGDLIASKLKRDHDIKDFSNLFPGHGGVLDRFDSTLFASMLLMVFLLFLGGV